MKEKLILFLLTLTLFQSSPITAHTQNPDGTNMQYKTTSKPIADF